MSSVRIKKRNNWRCTASFDKLCNQCVHPDDWLYIYIYGIWLGLVHAMCLLLIINSENCWNHLPMGPGGGGGEKKKKKKK